VTRARSSGSGSRAFYRLINAFERFEVPADGGDFRLMDRAVVDALLACPSATAS
jgi:hypothetical protein